MPFATLVRLIFIFLILLTTACASMGGKRQTLKVVTTPPGANILFNGEKVGVTPQFIEIPRSKNNILTLEKDDKTYQYDLKARYRWIDSFASNIIFFSPLTAIGWGVDLLTGAAWQYEDLPRIKLSGISPNQPKRRLFVLVAPPQTENDFLSRELAGRLKDQWSKSFPNEHIETFEKRRVPFERYDYRYNNIVHDGNREALYAELTADVLIESTVESLGEGKYKINSKARDVFSNEPVKEISSDFKLSDTKYYQKSAVQKFFVKAADIFPNSAGLDFSNRKPKITFTDSLGLQYTSTERPSKTVLHYLSSINIRNLNSNNFINRFRGTFSWSSAILLSYAQMQFSNNGQPGPLSGVDFNWYQAQAGIGPQLGLTTPAGFIYMEIVPILGGSWVTWRKSQNYYEVNKVTLTSRTEIGYSLQLSQNINFKIYLASVAADAKQWTHVGERATGTKYDVVTPQMSYTGATISYFWPQARETLRSLIE